MGDAYSPPPHDFRLMVTLCEVELAGLAVRGPDEGLLREYEQTKGPDGASPRYSFQLSLEPSLSSLAWGCPFPFLGPQFPALSLET